MTSVQAEEIVDIYRELTAISQPTVAKIRSINNKFSVVYTEWSQRDLEKIEKTTFTQNYIINSSDNSILLKTPSQEIKNELWNRDSPSGKYQAIFRSWTNKKGDEKQFLEVWDGNGKIKNFDVLASEKHGKVNNNDGEFGCLQWSGSEDRIVYVAEKKLPKTKSFFDTQTKDEDKKEEIVKGREYDFVECWGEGLPKKSQPSICVLNISTGSIQVLDTPPHLSCAQAEWSPGDTGIVFRGFNNNPFKLGIKYCSQRESGLFYYEFESGKTVLLSDETKASRSPVFSPDQSKLVYIDQPIGGAHKQCGRLMMLDWKTRKYEVVIDIVNNPTDGGFYGLFLDNLSSRCWSEDNQNVVFNTYHRSTLVVYSINVDTKSFHIITSGLKDKSCSVLDVYKDRVILSCSAPNQPHFLLIGTMSFNKANEEIKWTKLNESQILENISYEIVVHKPTLERTNPKYANIDYESILVLPKQNGNTKPPLILFPHGGPHSCFDTCYMLYVAGFCRCGFAVLLVNYRGSVGFGQDSIQSILGNVGDQDVKDVKAAADQVIEQGLVDGNKVYMFGGSHGGFLTTHLIGQYPEFIKAACCRNPVTNLTVMSGVTDIPDWVWIETGLEYNHTSMIDGKTCEEMWKRSPVRYIDQVKAPLILMIGPDDLRVPPSQSREFYQALRSRNVDTRLLVYEENSHPIIKVDSEADAFVNVILWFNKYC